MPIKLLTRKTERGIKHIGDIISIRDTSWIFNQNELEQNNQFIIDTVEIDGKKINATVENVKAHIKSVLPEMKVVYEDGGKYYDTPSIQDVLNNTEKKTVWLNGATWQELKQKPFKKARYIGTEFIENISREPVNLSTEIIIEASRETIVEENKVIK